MNAQSVMELPRSCIWLNAAPSTLQDHAGRPLVLAFVNGASVWCMQRLAEVAQWQARNPGRLQAGTMQALDLQSCRGRMGKPLGEKMLCAVPPTDARGRTLANVFSCRGDSGGPLIRTLRGQDMLVGVASWSYGCGFGNYASVYTDVAKYAAWIGRAQQELQAGKVVWVDAQLKASTQPPSPPPARQ